MASFVVVPPKFDSSTIDLPIDFISQLLVLDDEALVAATVSCVVSSGTDPSPSSMLSGDPVLTQNVVTQTITGGLPGVIYTLGFNATTNLSNQLIIYVNLAVLSEDSFSG